MDSLKFNIIFCFYLCYNWFSLESCPRQKALHYAGFINKSKSLSFIISELRVAGSNDNTYSLFLGGVRRGLISRGIVAIH